MFQLSHQTTHHSLPDMERTFAVLTQYMQDQESFLYKPGRSAHYVIPNVIADGLHILLSSDTFDDVEITGEPTEANDEQEVKDEGDLMVE